jgi:hypothetical protein
MELIRKIYAENNNKSRGSNKRSNEVIRNIADAQALQLQDEIRRRKVRVVGEPGAQTRELINAGFEYLEGIRKTEEGKKKESAILELAEELGIDKEKLKKSFQQGLKNNIIAADKAGFISKKLSDKDIKILINTVITDYYLDFKEVLTCFTEDKKAGRGSTSKFILEFTERIYLLSPKILGDLRNTYKDVDDWIIKNLTLSNPRNPEEAIKNRLQKIEQLKSKFSPEIEKGVIIESEIERFVVYNFKKALEALEANREQALQLFQDFKEKRGLIKKESGAKRRERKAQQPTTGLSEQQIQKIVRKEQLRIKMIKQEKQQATAGLSGEDKKKIEGIIDAKWKRREEISRRWRQRNIEREK